MRFPFYSLSYDSASNAAITPDGTLLVAGGITEAADSKGIGMVAFDPASGDAQPIFDGSAFRAYWPCRPCIISLRTMMVTPAGAIALGGAIQNKMFVSRLLSNGSADASFADNGYLLLDVLGPSESVAALVSQGERLVAAGFVRPFGNFDFAVFRLSDGRLFSDQFEPE